MPWISGFRSVVLGFGLFGCALASVPCHAGSQLVAVVESISGEIEGIAPFTLLSQGQSIGLAPGARIVISYFNSCSREIITGGTVLVGEDGSTIKGGEIAARTFKCNIAALNLTPEQRQSAAFVLRDMPTGDPIADRAQFVSPSVLPLLLVAGDESVTVTDLRNPERHWEVATRNGIADLSEGHGPFEKGGVYQVLAGQQKVIFRIKKDADGDLLPLLTRLLPL